MHRRPPWLVVANPPNKTTPCRVSSSNPRTHVFARRSHGYSYTERKRIRKVSAPAIACSKFLICCNAERRVHRFLAGRYDPQKNHRRPSGCIHAAFPIVSHNGFVEMKFVEYNLAKPAFDVRECQNAVV